MKVERLAYWTWVLGSVLGGVLCFYFGPLGLIAGAVGLVAGCVMLYERHGDNGHNWVPVTSFPPAACAAIGLFLPIVQRYS